MDADKAFEEQLFNEDSEPDIGRLAGAYQETLTGLGSWIDQQRRNYEVRHCIWSGQTDDGRKHGDKNHPAFPWENASDLRPYIVDSYITAGVDLLTTSLSRSKLSAYPVESGDAERSRLVTAFMRWLMFSQMEEIEDEAEMLANFFLEKGIGAVGVFWDTKVTNRLQQFDITQIAEVAPDLAQAIQDKENTEEIADLLQTFFPQVSRRKAKKMITSLRNDGVAEIGVPEVIHQRPCIRAYSLDQDLFVPVGVTDIQKAPYIFKEEWFTPEQLRTKSVTDGWSRDFIDHVIETQREETLVNEDNQYVEREWEDQYNLAGNEQGANIRLVCAYWRATNDDGIPAVYYTVFHPYITNEAEGTGLKKPYAISEQLDYRPARYPFVLFNRERLSRRMLETRGYPEIAKDWQNQIKIERDMRIDRSSLATNPPFMYRQGKAPPQWGPGAKVPFQRPEDYQWATIPQFDQGSIEVEQFLFRTMNSYFGAANDETERTDANTKKQHLVSRWLRGWKMVFRQVWDLYKQYGPDEQFFRVTGAQPKQERMVKGDEQEKFDFYLDFNVPGLDPEFMLDQLEKVGNLATSFDRSARFDWSEFMERLVGAVDPTMADTLLMPQDAATQKEVEEEQELLTKIWSGMDVDIQPPVNAQLRLQVLQNYLTGSETIPAQDVQRRMEEDEAFRARVEKHQQQLQHVIEQQKNAEIGRIGTQPGNME